MTQIVSNLSKVEFFKQYLANYLQQLTIDYQQTQQERKIFVTHFNPSTEEFTPLEEIEWLTTQLRGYASQLQSQGYLSQPEEAKSYLYSLNIFMLPSLTYFYWETEDQYPLLKSYLQKLDYLRLLILDYLREHDSYC